MRSCHWQDKTEIRWEESGLVYDWHMSTLAIIAFIVDPMINGMVGDNKLTKTVC